MPDEPDYWCIAATNYELSDGWVVYRSLDTEQDDILFDSFLTDLHLDKWLEGKQPGLYRLVLKYCNDGEVEITDYELLIVYPPISAPTAVPASGGIIGDYTAIARAMKR